MNLEIVGPTVSLALGGLFVMWRSKRKEALLKEWKLLQDRKASPTEKNYLYFVVQRNSIPLLLECFADAIKRDYCYDITKPLPLEAKPPERIAVMYQTLLLKSTLLYERYAIKKQSSDPNKFLLDWEHTFPDSSAQPLPSSHLEFFKQKGLATFHRSMKTLLRKYKKFNNSTSTPWQFLLNSQCVNTFASIQHAPQDPNHPLNQLYSSP